VRLVVYEGWRLGFAECPSDCVLRSHWHSVDCDVFSDAGKVVAISEGIAVLGRPRTGELDASRKRRDTGASTEEGRAPFFLDGPEHLIPVVLIHGTRALISDLPPSKHLA
jgi:hypothetical protein